MIRERQRKIDCEAAGIPYVPDELAVRKAPNCDPDIPATPDVLLEPNPAPLPDAPDRVLPRPLIVRSPAFTAHCADHGGGSGSATAAYGESIIDLYLDDVESVTRSALYRIAAHHAALQAAMDSHLEPLALGQITAAVFDAAIMSAATIEAAAAAGIRQRALELRGGPDAFGSTGLYAIAEITALSRLECTFVSQALWVVCDSESPTGFSRSLSAPSPLPSPDLYRTRPAGYRVSTISVEDANESAELDAVSDPTFECVYVSEPVTVNCADDVDGAFGQDYEPAFLWEGGYYNNLEDLHAAGFTSYALDSLTEQRALIYSVTLSGGLFPSASQSAANERARAFAVQQLNCFFPSREATVDCENRSPDNPVTQRMLETGKTREQVFTEMDSEHGVNPDLVTNFGLLPLAPGPGRSIDSKEGLIVKIPAGLVMSTSSPEEADDEAMNHARGFLSCFWVSPRVTCSCLSSAQENPEAGSFEFTEAELVALQAVFNATVSSELLTFEKGALGSSEDGFIPVDDAMGLCRASLVCVYCNQTIAPRCSVAYTDGGVSYNLWNPQTDTELPISLTTRNGVSTGVSAGLPSLVICDSNPRSVNTLAIATASLPPVVNNEVGNPKCLYGNREVTRTCVDKVGANAFGLTPESAGRSLTVSAGSFEAESQLEADDLAETFIDAALICEFGNPPMTVLCGAAANATTIFAGEYTVAATYGTGQGVTALTAIGGAATPLTVGAHVFTSLESPLNAKAQALLSMVTQLNCFWESAQIDLMCTARAACPPGLVNTPETGVITEGDNSANNHPLSVGATAGDVRLARRTFSSYVSQAEANRQAYTTAFSMLDCFWKSAQIELLCDASPVCPAPNTPWSGTIVSGNNDRNFCPDSTGDEIGEVTVTRGEVTSYVSQALANYQAYDLAYPQLDCFWQSARIVVMCGAPPICPTPSTPEDGVINAGSNADNCSTESTGARPTDIVVSAKSVTSYVSQADANYQAYEMAYPQLDCFWLSAKIDLLCDAPPFCPQGKRYTSDSGTIREGDNKVQERLGESTYSDQSIGYKSGDAVMDRKAVQSYVSQGDANDQAYAMVWPMLDCFWHNARMRVWCTPPPTLGVQLRLIGPNGWVDSGSGPVEDPVIVPARDVQSYRSQEDANLRAYYQAKDQLVCQTNSHPFSLSGSPTFACCKTKFGTLATQMSESKLFNPPQAGADVTGNRNGYTEVELKLKDATACSFYPAYFYLEATVSKSADDQYRASSAKVIVSKSLQSLLEGSEGAYTKVRRLIAEVTQDDTGSVFNSDARDLCGGLRIAQSVTSAQKIATSTLGAKTFPVIADLHSPLGGGAANSCGNFKLYAKTENETTNVMIGNGQVGSEFLSEESMGTLNSLKGQLIFLLVTLNDSAGTYTVEAQNGGTFPTASDSEKAIYVGKVTESGAIEQGACGPFDVTVCRRLYVAEAPYHTLSVTMNYGYF